jgi:isoamylase
VTGRSLALFVLRPTHTKGQSTDAERSYQHVMQAFEDASSESVALPAGSALEAILSSGGSRPG